MLAGATYVVIRKYVYIKARSQHPERRQHLLPGAGDVVAPIKSQTDKCCCSSDVGN